MSLYVIVIAFDKHDANRVIESMKLVEAYGPGNVFTVSERRQFSGRHPCNAVITKKAKGLINYMCLKNAAKEVCCSAGGVVVEEL